MKKQQIIGIFLLALVLVLSSCEKKEASEKIHLHLKLEKGKTYDQLLTIKQDIKSEVQSQEQKMQQTMQFGFNFKVNDIFSDGLTSMTCTYSSIKFEMAMGEMKISYDSQNPEQDENPMGKILGSFLNKTFNIKFTPKMEVREISGMNEILNSLIESMGLDDNQKVQVMDQFSRQFSDEAMKESFQSSFNIFPDKPIGVGDTWTDTLDFSKTLPMTVITNYTVKERKDGKMTLAFNSVIETNKEASNSSAFQSKMEYKISGTMNGTSIIDEATGWTLSSSVDQKINGSIVVEIEGKSIESPINIESIITLEQK